jgi:hypothetical protein
MTQKLVFKRGNLDGDDHPLPAIAEVLSLLSCSYPSSIALIADEPGTNYFLYIKVACTHFTLIFHEINFLCFWVN